MPGSFSYSCKFGFVALVLLAALAPALPVRAQTTAPAASLDSATGAYLLNFLRFVEWPPSARLPAASAPYIIGVSGNRPLLDTLIRLVEGQRVRGHPILVVKVKNINDLLACNLVYLEPPGTEGDSGLRLAEALLALRGMPVLTVSTAENFTVIGGNIQLFREASSLRFNIATQAFSENGLTFNSRLLALSRPLPTSR